MASGKSAGVAQNRIIANSRVGDPLAACVDDLNTNDEHVLDWLTENAWMAVLRCETAFKLGDHQAGVDDHIVPDQHDGDSSISYP